MKRRIALLAVVSILATPVLQLTANVRQSPDVPLTQNQLIETRIFPQLDHLFHRLVAEKREMTLDGQKVFTGGDRFLPGKIALGLSYLLINTLRSDPKFSEYLAGYRDIADLTADDVNETWGIYYYVSALNKLRKAGLLKEAIRPATLQKLQQKLDWRPFVRVPELTLVSLPTNYYGVAFSIARLRMLLGWENASGSQKLLEKILAHYERYSGEYGFSDETDGEGRFDRYSVLLIGEICERLIETEMDVTPQLKKWLRKSADLVLVNLNSRGDGFSYGRSIGPYGDTAFLEVLSAAAYFDVLTKTEKEMAYGFATSAVRKYVDFWHDADMRSVNIWEKGRATDGYRNKTRILGKNFSLSDQLIKTNGVWNAIGFKNKRPSGAFESWLRALPAFTLTWFARGEYDRALVTYRDGSRIFSLPIVNGGRTYHSKNPYFPIPYSHGMVEATPDAEYPLLVPRFSLTDGSELMPLAYGRAISTERAGDGWTVKYRQDELDRLGAAAPIKDGRMTVEVTYRLMPGSISRTESYVPLTPIKLNRISLEFASFSSAHAVEGTRISFKRGDVYELAIEGLEACAVQPATNMHRSPGGPMTSHVVCLTAATILEKPFTIGWTLKYRD